MAAARKRTSDGPCVRRGASPRPLEQRGVSHPSPGGGLLCRHRCSVLDGVLAASHVSWVRSCSRIRRREVSSRGNPVKRRGGGCVFSFSFRAVEQPLVPVLGKHSIQTRSLQPQWRKFFHVRDRELLQSFMSSLLLQTEDTKKLQSKISSSY